MNKGSVTFFKIINGEVQLFPNWRNPHDISSQELSFIYHGFFFKANMIQMVVLGIKVCLLCDFGLGHKLSLYSAEIIDFILLCIEVQSQGSKNCSVIFQAGEPSKCLYCSKHSLLNIPFSTMSSSNFLRCQDSQD